MECLIYTLLITCPIFWLNSASSVLKSRKDDEVDWLELPDVGISIPFCVLARPGELFLLRWNAAFSISSHVVHHTWQLNQAVFLIPLDS